MGLYSEFKTFVSKGGIIELAIGIVIGVAFGKVVTSFVSDILMPPIGLLLGRVDFSNLFVALSGAHYESVAAAKAAGAATLNYGIFINTVIEFLIIAFAVFMLLKAINRMRGPAPAAPAATKKCAFCAQQIPLEAHRCPYCTSELEARTA